MDLIITLLPMVTEDLPISPRFTPYDFLSRCKFSNLTTHQPMVGSCTWYTLYNGDHCIVPGIPSTTEIVVLYLVYPQPRRSLYCTRYTLNHGDRCIVPGIPSTTKIVMLYLVYPLPRRSLYTWYTLYHGDRCIVPGIPSTTEIVVLYLVYPQPRRSLYCTWYTLNHGDRCIFIFFIFFISLTADGPHHYHPACGH